MTHWYEMCCVKNIVNNCVISLYDEIVTRHHYHFEMDRNIKTLFCVTGTNMRYSSIILQKQTGKEIRFVVTRGRAWRVVELNENSQKVQISSYK